MRRSEPGGGALRPRSFVLTRALVGPIVAVACLVGGVLVAQPARGAPASPAGGHAEAHHHHDGGTRGLVEADFRRAPKDLVLWGDLARVGVTRRTGRVHVTFLPPVLALDGKTVTLVGFMAPVDPGKRHRRFLLSDQRFLCDDCHATPRPESIVEVHTRVAEPTRGRPIMVRGTLELVRDDPNGLIYRLKAAKVIRRQR